MNKQAIALLSLGHFLIDFCQGVVPALVPFLVVDRAFFIHGGGEPGFRDQCDLVGRAAPFRPARRSTGSPWLLPASVFLAGRPCAGGTIGGLWRGLGGVRIERPGSCGLSPGSGPQGHLASGDRRTTGMSLFSVGGGLGFALAPALTTAVFLSWGTSGLLASWLRPGSSPPCSVFLQPRGAPAHSHKRRDRL